MSDIAGEKVPGAVTIGDLQVSELKRARNGANEDVKIHVVAPVDFPYHKWLAFSAAVSSNVVRLMKEHGLVARD